MLAEKTYNAVISSTPLSLSHPLFQGPPVDGKKLPYKHRYAPAIIGSSGRTHITCDIVIWNHARKTVSRYRNEYDGAFLNFLEIPSCDISILPDRASWGDST